MSQEAVYKGKKYHSRSQCALAMIADGLPQRVIATHLGISDQAVSAVKKRAEVSITLSIRRARKQATEAINRAKKLNQKTEMLSQIFEKIMTNTVDSRKKS